MSFASAPGSRAAGAAAPAPASASAVPLLVRLSTVDGRDVVVNVQPGHTLLESVQRALLTQRAMEQLQLLRRVRGVITGATEAFTADAHVLRGVHHVPVTLDSTDRAPQIAHKVNAVLAQGVAAAAPAPTVSVAQRTAAYEQKTKAHAASAADAKHSAGRRPAGALGKGERSVYALRTDARSDSLLRQQPHVRASAAAASAATAAGDNNDAEEDDDDDAATAGAGKEREEVWLPPVAGDDDDDAAAALTPDLLAAKLGAATGAGAGAGSGGGDDVTEAQCRSVFARFDRNGDGHIDADELEAVCGATGVKPWRALKELDADRDGRISWSEFVNWWKRDRARCALESAAGVSYENVHAFRAAPLQRRRGSRNLNALTTKRDSLTAPPPPPDALAPAHTVTGADVAAAAITHRHTDSGGRGSLSGAAAFPAGAAANGDASLRRASAAALDQMGSQLAAAARVAHGLEMTPAQRAEVTKKFRAVQFAVHDLEAYLTRLLQD